MPKPANKFDPPQPQTPQERMTAIETVIPHLATKEDVAEVKVEVAEVKGKLQILVWIWGIQTAVIAAAAVRYLPGG